jgi:hypothetical protein
MVNKFIIKSVFNAKTINMVLIHDDRDLHEILIFIREYLILFTIKDQLSNRFEGKSIYEKEYYQLQF